MAPTTKPSSPRDRTRDDLLRLIQRSDSATRAGLVSVTGLSRSTVNHAIGRLLAEGRVIEVEPQVKGPGSGSGRPATRLRATPPDAHIAGIDFGHSHVNVAIADASGGVVAEQTVQLDVDLLATDALDAAADVLSSLQHAHSIGSLAALVAGIPGPVDNRVGVVRSPTILSSWVALNPAEELARRLNTAVHVENDAVLGAYGEMRQGAGRGYVDFIYVKASHGVGACAVINGVPYQGTSGVAGEIGHTQLAGRSELCRCGNRGCLEAVVSVESIRSEYAQTHPGAQSRRGLPPVEDAVTERILNEAGRIVGGVLAPICNMLNPAALIVGGELGATRTPFVDGIEASVRRHSQPATSAALTVLPAELGARAELVGALQLAAARLMA